jgi:hypothetical protein
LRRRSRRIRALPFVALAALAFPSGVWATHNADLHSPNVEYVGIAPKPTNIMTDLAFWGDLAVAGEFRGFRIIDVSRPSQPTVVADVNCSGEQNDVAVWENLLILSIDTPQTTTTCDSTNTARGVTGFEGLRIFDITTPSNPRLIKAVQTDCGSHTHTLVPDLKNGRILVYVSSAFSSTFAGPTPYGTTCVSPHGKISVVSIPLANPAGASVIAQPPASDRGCHDIGVFTGLNLAAGACRPHAIVWDISDPVNPVVLRQTTNPAVPNWHSGAFTWDGEIALFSHEAGGFACQDPGDQQGRVWFYRTSDLTLLGSFKIPRPQMGELCTSHVYNVVPAHGRYVFVSSWYEGGNSIVDFTNPAAPVEIGYYDPRQIPPGAADTWSTYWYNDLIYTNDGADDRKAVRISRGMEILRLKEPWAQAAFNLEHFNPQTQELPLRCRIRIATSKPLRAGERGHFVVAVRVFGQPVPRQEVTLRAPGLARTIRTGPKGAARVGFTPARRGALRATVPDELNMFGCKGSRAILRARPRVAVGPAGALTGRPR